MTQTNTTNNLELRFVDSLADIGEENWSRLAGRENPFMRYEFLWALEETGCTTEESGWKPHHAVIYDDTQKAIAVMPLYKKTNSYGEYVFDWSWASAYQNYGLDYYPKFVSAAPFTPSHGERLFVDDSITKETAVSFIFEKLKEKAEFINASSWHILFPEKEDNALFESIGIPARTACQFHWFNRGYESFEDFLESMNSRKRKNIRKERQKVREQGVEFKIVDGTNISDQQWDTFYQFYQSTYMMRGMQGYLSQDFFKQIARTMPEQLFMNCAMKDDRIIAAALFFRNSDKLFGRYWGSARDYQFLHFETCYSQGQEYCIEHGLKSFDSGAQGEHKIQRGFEPIITYSNHWIADQRFADAINNFLDEERPHIDRYREEAASLLPFRKSDSSSSK